MTTALPPAGPPQPRWLAWWARYRHLVAVASFAAGIASFALVQRQEKFAQALAILLPLSWLAALLEPWLIRKLATQRWLRHSSLLLHYGYQALHQESFFFTLPCFLATTTGTTTQPLFVLALGALALISIIDPLYFGRITSRRAGLWSFHAAASFLTVLTAAPMLWQISTSLSLNLAIGAASALIVPAVASALRGPATLRWLVGVGAALVLAGGLHVLRFAIPPATLRVHDAAATQAIDVEAREPSAKVKWIDAATLRAGGLYAWTPIHAPRGLSEQIVHEWWHQGLRVDRIPIAIHGGREQGYRAWTHKTVFPDDPRGDWQIRVVTQSDQLIGIIRFEVR